jgi:hypothetical protein
MKRQLVSVLLFALGVVGVGTTQPRLAAITKGVKATDDIYPFPPPDELRALTLGYHAAATDLLWAKLLVEYGMHWSEKRPFETIPLYVDAILALEPTYSPIYRYVDTFLVYRPLQGTESDVRRVRAYLERGLKERPNDHRIWRQYGQFIAFSAPTFLTSQDEIAQWRLDGANAMARAVELGADVDRAVTAASMLSKVGERDAAIRSLRRAYALTDDPQVRADLVLRLQRLQASAAREAAERDAHFIESRWHRDFLTLSRGEFLLLGPAPDPLTCAGRGKAECELDWGPVLPSTRESGDDETIR